MLLSMPKDTHPTQTASVDHPSPPIYDSDRIESKIAGDCCMVPGELIASVKRHYRADWWLVKLTISPALGDYGRAAP
jgi:hypothetical protein